MQNISIFLISYMVSNNSYEKKKKDGKNYIFYTSQEHFSYFITNSIVLQLFSLKKYIYDLSMTGFEVVDLEDIKIISLLLIN